MDSLFLLTQNSGKILGPIAKVLGYLMNAIYAFMDKIFTHPERRFNNHLIYDCYLSLLTSAYLQAAEVLKDVTDHES